MATGGTSTTFEKENANFFRCTYLLLDLGAEVLREVFRTYYKPSSLQAYLLSKKTKLDSLLKNKVLSPAQHNLLFPAASAPDDKQFDITLLSCLIRNLNTTYRVGDRIWTNPSSTDLSIEADVTRVRKARNELHGHAESSTMPDQLFAKEKNNLEQIYTRIVNNLGRPSTVHLSLTSRRIKDKIEDITHSPLERERHSALLSLLDTWHRLDMPQELTLVRDELSLIVEDQSERHRQVKQQFTSVKDDLHEVKQEMSKLKDVPRMEGHIEEVKDKVSTLGKLHKDRHMHLEKEIVGLKMETSDLRGEILHLRDLMEEEKSSKSTVDRRRLERRIEDTLMASESHKKENAKTYIETRAYKATLNALETEKLVILSGIPGSGKSFLSWSITYDCIANNNTSRPIKLNNISEWETLVDPFEKHMIIIDDFLGKYGLDIGEVNQWRSNANIISANIDKGNLSVVMTVRKHLLSALKQTECFDSLWYEDPFSKLLDRFKVIDLSSELYMLTTEEKHTMLDRYLNETNIKIEKDKSTAICEGKGIIGFPQSCYMLKAVREKMKPEVVFTKPDRYLFMEIEKMSLGDQRMFVVLVLLVVFGGKLSSELLETEHEKKEKVLNLIGIKELDEAILSVASTMLETYLTKESENYSFQHDLIHETCFIILARKYPVFTIQTCPIDIVCKLCQVHDVQRSSMGSGDWEKFQVQFHHLPTVGKRFREDICCKCAMKLKCISAANIWGSEKFTNEFFSQLKHENLLLHHLSMTDENGDTLLVHCSAVGQIHLLTKIIESLNDEQFLNQEEVQTQMNRALLEACKVNKVNVIDILFESIVSVCSSVIFTATKAGNIKILTKLSTKSKQNLNEERNEDGKSLLSVACREGEDKMVIHLIDKFPELINSRDGKGEIPLYPAIKNCSKETITLLIERGSDLTITTNKGINTLFLACKKDNLDIVKIIDAKCPQLKHMKDNNGLTPALITALTSSVEVQDYLICNGIDVMSSLDADGATALSLACLEGKLEMVKFLTSKFPQLNNIKNNNGLSPIHYAARGGNVQVVELLLETGADIMSRDVYGATVLSLACLGGKLEMVKFLTSKFPQLNNIKNNNGLSPIHYAASGGNVQVVELLLETGADIMSRDVYGATVLSLACLCGKLEMVKFLTSKFPQLNNIKNNNGRSPIHYNAQEGNVQVLELLLETGADIMSRNVYGATVLSIACLEGKLEMVEFLTSKFPQLNNIKDNNGRSPIHYAARGGNVQVVELLLETGADIMSRDDADGATTLSVACLEGELEMVEFLTSKFPQLNNIKDNNGRSPIHDAAQGGNVQVVELLLETGADVMSRDDADGATTLSVACLEGKLEMVEFLTSKFPQLNNIKDNNGRSPIHDAAQGGNVQVVELLLETGADIMSRDDADGATTLSVACLEGELEMVEFLTSKFPQLNNIKNNNGRSPIHYAAQGGNVQVVELLLETGADIMSRDVYGATVLSLACLCGKLEMVKFLTSKFPQLNNIKNNNGQSPIHYNAQEGNVQVVELLLETGADIMSRDVYGATVLSIACLEGKLEMVEFLTSKFPQLNNIKDNNGRSPIHYAAQGGNVQVVELLLETGADIMSRDKLSKTVLWNVCQEKQLDMARFFVKKFPQLLNIADLDGATPLYVSAEAGSVELVQLLSENGANLYVKNCRGKSALDIALKKGHSEIVLFLESMFPNLIKTTEVKGVRKMFKHLRSVISKK